MQIASYGDNLHELWNPTCCEKNKKQYFKTLSAANKKITQLD